jgi:hypothetical protein
VHRFLERSRGSLAASDGLYSELAAASQPSANLSSTEQRGQPCAAQSCGATPYADTVGGSTLTGQHLFSAAREAVQAALGEVLGAHDIAADSPLVQGAW